MDRMVDINTRIAARVRVLRAASDLSLEALANRCDVSRSMLSLVERGETSPTAVVLEKIATKKALDDEVKPLVSKAIEDFAKIFSVEGAKK